jgi:hypothetical protein
MNNSIVSISTESSQSSPFDSIRRYDEKGNEYWLARELQKILGYIQWRRFEDAIDRARVSISNQGMDITIHVANAGKLDALATLANPKISEDYKLSRHACYTIAMNGDPRKAEIAQAQSYFVAKTREAEVIIPAQNDRIRELELEVRALELRRHESDRQDFRIAAYGLATTLLLEGKADSVVEIDRPILEVIDEKSGARFEGQTTKQLADYLNKNGGRSFKSGAELERELNKLGRADLIDTVPRRTQQAFISKENINEACRILISNRQQQLF